MFTELANVQSTDYLMGKERKMVSSSTWFYISVILIWSISLPYVSLILCLGLASVRCVKVLNLILKEINFSGCLIKHMNAFMGHECV